MGPADNIPAGTDMSSQEPDPNYKEIVDDIMINGSCHLCGITLDDVINNAVPDTEHYAKILKLLVTRHSVRARDEADDYVRKLAYEMVEEHYK